MGGRLPVKNGRLGSTVRPGPRLLRLPADQSPPGAIVRVHRAHGADSPPLLEFGAPGAPSCCGAASPGWSA
ncbi:hypothetical protein NDU88_000908 [Pleurodeles waltl]|uniref:Uncharacterized protein n=1 Tax=Pleurodeles waltl TaxID=8319 RepID=A0AAV7U5C2_PLEWA|nr:hypothetical protein NDU88_000908 [Pleurodeles waltl]